MNVRSRMVMRTTVQRNTSPTNADGHPGAPVWADHLEQLECFAWQSTARDVKGDTVAVVEQIEIIAPSGTDVTNLDRLVSITDRQGNLRFPGPLEIERVTWEPGYLRLEAVSAR